MLNNKIEEEKLARNRIWKKKQEKKLDLYYDSVWVNYIVKMITGLGSGVGALIYKELGMILFFYNNVIFYKVMMDEQNSLIPPEIHKKRAKEVLKKLKLGQLQIHAVTQSQEQFKQLDTSGAVKK
jgi:hypothetical protein